MDPIDVVAGIIFRDEKLLIARRRQGKSLAGKWEFPGGKIEEESNQAALKRELQEELGIKIDAVEYFASNTHQYSNQVINLHAYLCQTTNEIQKNTDHDELIWITPSQLTNFEFAEADIPIVSKLIDVYSNRKPTNKL